MAAPQWTDRPGANKNRKEQARDQSVTEEVHQRWVETANALLQRPASEELILLAFFILKVNAVPLSPSWKDESCRVKPRDCAWNETESGEYRADDGSGADTKDQSRHVDDDEYRTQVVARTAHRLGRHGRG